MWHTEYLEIKKIRKDTTELWVRGPKIKDLNFLNDYPNVKKLFLSTIKTDYLTPISKLKDLIHLELTNVGNGTNLDFISHLNKLEILRLQTPVGWDGSGKVIKYISLNPLSNLRKLKELTLLDVVFENDGLEPLIKIKSLSQLTTRNRFTTRDFAKLAKYKPDLNCQYTQPYTTLEGYEYYQCKRCKETKVEFSGIDLKRRVFCPNCNESKYKELIERFYRIKNVC